MEICSYCLYNLVEVRDRFEVEMPCRYEVICFSLIFI